MPFAEKSPDYPPYPNPDNRLVDLPSFFDKIRSGEWSRTTRSLVAIGITALALNSANVDYNRTTLEDTHPEITRISDPSSEETDRATLVIAGLGNLDSGPTAAALSAYEESNRVTLSLKYDDAGINTDAIAKAAIEKAEAQEVDKLSFSGHSIGGDVSLEVARKIQESDTDISVPFVMLDCTPPTIEAVRPGSRDAGYLMAWLLEHIKSARYSDVARFIAEEAARFDQYKDFKKPLLIDVEEFVKSTKTIIEDKFLANDVASTSLIESQFKMAVAAGAHDDIVALGRDNGKPKTILFFLRPHDSEADETVDNDLAEKQFREYADEAGLEMIVVPINGTQHASPIQNPVEYNAKIKQVLASLEGIESHNLHQLLPSSHANTIQASGQPNKQKTHE